MSVTSDASAGPHTYSMQGREITGTAIVHTVEFWQLFTILAMLAGVGLMTIKYATEWTEPYAYARTANNNFSNIGNNAKALWRHHDPSTPESFLQGREQLHVSILSFASFVGRFLSGVGSDHLITSLHASRFWCLVASAVIFTAAQLAAIIITTPQMLFIVSSLTGAAYGALFGVFPALTADAFGVQGLSLNWGFMIFAPVVSGNFYNLAYGAIYDAQSKSQRGGSGSGEKECLAGRQCYMSAYYVTLASSAAGVIMALWCVRYEATMKRTRLIASRRNSNAYIE